jgi:predicted Zn-dependent protease
MKYKDFFNYLFENKLLIERVQRLKKLNTLLEKNNPTSPQKWQQAKAAAKRKFKVYPSAYANLWAAKKYKSMGGKWKKGKND